MGNVKKLKLPDLLENYVPKAGGVATVSGLMWEVASEIRERKSLSINEWDSWKSRHEKALYCTKCGGFRKIMLSAAFLIKKSVSLSPFLNPDANGIQVRDMLFPGMFVGTCLQCNTVFFLLCWFTREHREIAVLSSTSGGVATPNTPESVAYYLDQAYRAKSVGAMSAAAAMYRAALEQLLYDQGFSKGKLSTKIMHLTKDKQNKTGKLWVQRISDDTLKLIRDLGNSSIHPNRRNVLAGQNALDLGVMTDLDGMFAELLDDVYEYTLRNQSQKASIGQATQAMRSGPAPKRSRP